MSSWWSSLVSVVTFLFGADYEEENLIVCDATPGLGSFETERYMGRWFSIWQSKDLPFHAESDRCITGEYLNFSNGNEFDVVNSFENDAFEGRYSGNRKAKCYEQDPLGQCQLT